MFRDVIEKIYGESSVVPELVVTAQDDLCESTFIICAYILEYLKQESTSVILVNMRNSFNYYHNFCLRSGVNLRTAVVNGRVLSIDVVKDTSYQLVQEIDGAFAHCIPDVFELYSAIKTFVKDKSDQVKVLVLIDDITILLSLGIQIKALSLFLLKCLKLTSEEKCCVLVCGSEGTAEDEDTLSIMNYAKHLSKLRIKVTSLTRGINQDAHGQLHIEKCLGNGVQSQELFHYRIKDKAVQLFPQGTSLAVLCH